ncbi:esterase FE4-like [Aricia agestis]|uniref:esterase FE4-like n=1 Tax=Aricia agestis TaxID=91739 RepID=UPI001C2041FD|nr:esterase FE4-like [Aricia agestis]
MMMKWLVLGSLFLVNLYREPTPVVRVRSGLVRGRISEDGKYHFYYGIPYGTVNDRNRFQAPLPPPEWDGVLDAVDETTRCPQKLLIDSVIVGNEDCLKLNVYTPAVRSTKPYSVMVYIHGGLFIDGSVSTLLYGPDYFLDHGVIYVAVSYRLNVEGFLCLGIKEAPGNAGLKDQVAALRWVKENIRAFGGDPDSVTLFGESAGAVSASHLTLSPVTKGLFHRTILQSGSSIVPWGIQHDPIRTASDLAKEFGYSGKDPYKIYETLANRTTKELIWGIKYKQHKNFVTAETLFVPCVEKEISGVEAVIKKHPIDIIQSGEYNKLPMIRGFNDKEGIYFVAKDFGVSVKNPDPHGLFQADLEFSTERSRNETAEEMLQQYFTKDNDEKVMEMVDLYSDLHVKFPLILESELFSKTNDKPMYFYVFTYDGYFNLAKYISKFIFSGGASHADELFYLFKSYILYRLPVQNNQMLQRMVTMWTNFAKYSDPTPTKSALLPFRWRPSRASNPTALVMGSELTTAPMGDEARVGFWNRTYTKYRRRHYGFENHTFVIPNINC